MLGPELENALPLDVRQRRAFQKPWHANAFAILLSLHQAGRFTWPQWTQAFAQQEKLSPPRPAECIDDAYYRRVTETLLDLLSARGLVLPAHVAAVESAWRDAYLSTPHGHPVELTSDALARSLSGEIVADPHDDDHHHHEPDHHHAGHRHAGKRHVIAPLAVFPALGG